MNNQSTKKVLIDNLGRIVGLVAPRTGKIGSNIEYGGVRDGVLDVRGIARIARKKMDDYAIEQLSIYDGNTGRPAVDSFNGKFPVAQDFHSGLWGWRRVNGCVDLSKCIFRSRAAASRDRNQSNEKAMFIRTGEICISL